MKGDGGLGPLGKRDAASGRSGPGDQGSPAVSPTSGGWPAARDPATKLCQAAWRERLRGAQSPQPTPAHTLPKSMLSAALGTSCRVASLQAPSPPRARKVGGGGARELEARPPPVAHWCPRPRSLPCLCSTPEASLAGSLHDWELRRGCHFPLPKARSEGGRRPGGAAACGVYLLAVRLPGARTPRGEQTGRKGVCEREDVGAHTRCHTQSPCFRSYRAVEGRGGAFHCPASFGVPTGWFDA